MVKSKSKTKTLNFSSLYESVLQRYIYEKLSFGSRSEKRALLPTFMQNKVDDIIAIVPEWNYVEHRADFVIILKKGKINLEVEWKSSRFNHNLTYYKENKGYVVVIEKDSDNLLKKNIEIIRINLNDFEEWFAINSSKLLEDTLSHHKIFEKQKNIWLIYLGNRAKKNFKIGVDNQCWAFKPQKGISEIIRIKKGDKILFVSLKGVQSRNLTLNAKYDLSESYLFECTRGHYFQLSDNEDPFIKIKNHREYYHFIGIKKESIFENDLKITSKKLKDDVKLAIRKSYNESGCPVKISKDSYVELFNLINFQNKK